MMKEFDLNVLAAPTYTVELPSTGAKVKMRALLTKEHKALLIANESNDKIDAIQQCLSNCIQSDINIEDLPVGDGEYLFLQMYMNSNGIEQLAANYRCTAPLPEEELRAKAAENKAREEMDEDDFFAEIVAQSQSVQDSAESLDDALEKVLEPSDLVCGEKISSNIDLTKAFVPKYEGPDVVKVNDGVSIKLAHPSIIAFENNDPLTAEGLFNLSVESIVEVHVGDAVYTKEELIKQDKLLSIMDELPSTAFKEIQKFVDEVPRLCCHIDVVCPKCGNTEKVTLRGIEDFFV